MVNRPIGLDPKGPKRVLFFRRSEGWRNSPCDFLTEAPHCDGIKTKHPDYCLEFDQRTVKPPMIRLAAKLLAYCCECGKKCAFAKKNGWYQSAVVGEPSWSDTVSLTAVARLTDATSRGDGTIAGSKSDWFAWAGESDRNVC
jgi:hypothetical protein